MATLTSISLNVNQNPINVNTSTGFSVTATYSDNTTKDVTDMCTYTYNYTIINLITTYLTFTALESGTFSFSRNNLQYSLDDGNTWTTLTANTSTPTITTGNKIMWKQIGLTASNINGIGTFSSTGNFNVSGNVMSIYRGDDFVNNSGINSYVFASLFKNCTKLINAENLVLPTNSFGGFMRSCYDSMFYGCTSLTTAPELPATELATYCYSYMFAGCTSLTEAPELPATTLSDSCYFGMFAGCTGLTTAPDLPATTLEQSCYYYMFDGCTSLTEAPELPATTLANSCYYGMFYGCTGLTTSPELPATTLVYYCYYYMFSGCSSLNYIKCLATDISATDCTTNWVNGVAATGTFAKAPSMTGWATGNNGIPTGWVVENYNPYKYEYLTFDIKSDGNIIWKMNSSSATAKTISYSKNNGTWTDITSTTSGVSIPVVTGDKVRFKGSNSAYATTSVASYTNSFGGTATFDVYGNIMSLIGGDNFSNSTTLLSSYTFTGLFYNCTGLISAGNIILPATTLADSCYYIMFSGCTSLTTAPELPATTLTDRCYYYMFSGCTSLTTAPELPATTLAQFCYNAMFQNCTSLTTAPELPATTLADYCYFTMFYGCTSLTSAPELPATTLARYCYTNMFQNCTSLTTAPELPATTLADYCQPNMFKGCTNLNYIKCLATNISASNCTTNWVNGVAATGTFVKNSNMSGWTTGNNGIPSGWTIQNA